MQNTKMKIPMQQLIDELRRINTWSTLDTADLIEKKYLPLEREAIEGARLDGFKISGEGFNGEYPHEGDSDEVIAESIKNSDYFTQKYGQ